MFSFGIVIRVAALLSDTMTCSSKPMKPNGKLEVPLEAVSSPPRTTLLGTIFSPVFNFFSPATKTGKTKDNHKYSYYLNNNINSLGFVNWLRLSLVFSHSWFRVPRASDGGGGNHQTAGHRAGRRNAEQHPDVHRGNGSVPRCPDCTTEASDQLRHNHRTRRNSHWSGHATINGYNHHRLRPLRERNTNCKLFWWEGFTMLLKWKKSNSDGYIDFF